MLFSECDPAKCEPMEQMPSCQEDQTLIAARVESTCCISYICGTTSWLSESLSVFVYAVMPAHNFSAKVLCTLYSSPNTVKLESGI